MRQLPPSPDDALPPPGWYRVTWVCDVEKVEAHTPIEAARLALEMQENASQMVANVFTVEDGDTGAVSEHDLAGS